MCVCINIYIYIYTYIYIYACMHVCMYVCICMCIYTYIYIYTCIYIYIYLYIYIYIYKCVYTRVYIYIYMHVCVCIHIYIYIYIHTCLTSHNITWHNLRMKYNIPIKPLSIAKILGEGAFDWDTVASSCSTGKFLSNFNKRETTITIPIELIWARWGFPTVSSPLLILFQKGFPRAMGSPRISRPGTLAARALSYGKLGCGQMGSTLMGPLQK